MQTGCTIRRVHHDRHADAGGETWPGSMTIISNKLGKRSEPGMCQSVFWPDLGTRVSLTRLVGKHEHASNQASPAASTWLGAHLCKWGFAYKQRSCSVGSESTQTRASDVDKHVQPLQAACRAPCQQVVKVQGCRLDAPRKSAAFAGQFRQRPLHCSLRLTIPQFSGKLIIFQSNMY